MSKRTAKRWVRNASDEQAVAAGHWFDQKRGQHIVDWIQRYCKLYEGEWAGAPLELVDWQYDVTMRLFGWVRPSKRWGRPVRRFNRASIWVPKKNKKSPTLAAWGLYLLAGDGESGQKVFFGAKDGKQAREIAGAHAVEMIRASAQLSSECTINQNLMRITHEPTRSYMQPMSSSNSRTTESKEGINGSILIDETHVVDRDFIGRISRAGISRSEPLQIEVSTAGDNPDGYGKSQYDYGKLVEAGHVDDLNFFFQTYEAPQDLTDAQLAEDPLKWGRMANPAMGHTVDPDELVSDYRRSCQSQTELANFKKYRLNIWQQSARPWLLIDDWSACAEFTADDLTGRQCWAALDLSRTRDLTALCLAFPEDGDLVRMLWWYWLPETYARDNADRVPFLQFADHPRCNFVLTPGDVLDFGYVKSHIRDLAEQYDIVELAYDDWNAEKVTQELCEGTYDRHGREIEPATGIERWAFGQGIRTFNEPTKEFERRVISRQIIHNGDPCTAWQVQHCQVREDQNGNLKPEKPKRDDVRKVDGLVVGIMALGRVMLGDRAEVWEPSGGVLL